MREFRAAVTAADSASDWMINCKAFETRAGNEGDDSKSLASGVEAEEEGGGGGKENRREE